MRAFNAVLLALLLTPVCVGPTRAHYDCPDWGSVDPDTYSLYQNVTWRTTYDSVQAYMNVKWSGSKESCLHHVIQTHGTRMTFDSHDLDYSMNAWSIVTNLPNPYPDYDDDEPGGTGDWKNEEAEVTTESSSFPSTNVRYSASFYYSHWYHQGGAYSGWYWDPSSGQIQLNEQLSKQYGFGDKWDTVTGQSAQVALLTYPYKSPPAGAALEGGELLGDGTAMRRRSADQQKIRIQPDVSAGLDGYARRARLAAVATARGGSATGVLTFVRPVTISTIARLSASGIRFETIEGSTSPDEQGLRWTISAITETAPWSAFPMMAAERGVEFLGITSATVLVPDVETLLRAEDDSDVYLVDLTSEEVRRSTGAHDVVMNDVYWNLANWTY